MGRCVFRRAGLACLILLAVACSKSSGGGPPFVWVCTPANYDFGNNTQAEIDIFNASDTTANVAAHFLAKNGANLASQPIPGTNPVVNYPGQTGTATALRTRFLVASSTSRFSGPAPARW